MSSPEEALASPGPHDLHAQIERLLSINKLEHAERLLAEAFRNAPDAPDNHYYAARIAHERSRHAEASSAIAEVLHKAPDHEGARLLFVSVAIEEKRYPQAEEMLLGLIRERPESGTLYAKYAWLMLLVLNVDKARALTREALRLSPTESLPQTLDLLLHLVEGSRGPAGQRLEELLRRDPESSRAAWLLLLVLTDEHRYAEALQIGQELLRASPHDREIVDTVIRLKAASHWIAKPNWPNSRFGLAGSAATWVVAVVALHFLERHDPVLAGIGALAWLAYVLYSWIHQPLLYRWLRYRGF